MQIRNFRVNSTVVLLQNVLFEQESIITNSKYFEGIVSYQQAELKITLIFRETVRFLVFSPGPFCFKVHWSIC